MSASCADCYYFRNEPEHLETLLPGLNALGSAYGSVRDRDGLCERHQRYLRSVCICAEYRPVAPSEDKQLPIEIEARADPATGSARVQQSTYRGGS